jgi:LysR family hca operon transcriptional activator
VELRQLRYFVALAEELNFRRTAERLHLSQPSLSQQIIALERDLGADLLLRDNRHVELTEAGRLFLVEARRTLAQADRARESVRAGADGQTELLRIGGPSFGGAPAFRHLLSLFGERHENVDVSLRSGSSVAELMTWLQDGNVDAIFLGFPPKLPEGLDFRVLERDPLLAVVPADHPLAGRPSIALDELNGLPFVTISRELHPDVYDGFFGELFPRLGITPSEVVERTSIEDQLGAVIDEGKITLMTSSMTALYRPEGVAHIPLQPPGLYVDQVLVWDTAHESSALGHLIRLCDEIVVT